METYEVGKNSIRRNFLQERRAGNSQTAERLIDHGDGTLCLTGEYLRCD